jgi:1,4-dihydroxy-2-naphthoate octaprenyltransferase
MTSIPAGTHKLPAPGSPGAWILAARPKTLPVAVAPVAVGAAVAHHAGSARWDAVAAALAGALLIQIGTNFANDVFDHDRGADAEDRVGPARAVQSGLLSAGRVRAGMVVAFALALCAGAYLAAVAGPVVVLIGAVSILCGVAYTGGPYPLGYHGLGDVFVFLFFGPVAVAGTAFVAIGRAPAAAFAASVSVGALAAAVLVVNNVRDRLSDARAGKRTLVVRWGRGFGLALFGGLVALSALAPIAGAALGLLPLSACASIVTAPAGFALARALARAPEGTREGGRRASAALARTALLLLVHAALLAAGIAAGAPRGA